MNGDGVWNSGDVMAFFGGLTSDGFMPVVGDWNGSGTTKIGTFNKSTGDWVLDYNGNFA